MLLSKYYRFDLYGIKALTAGGVWCQPASQQNDPFEGLPLKKQGYTEEDLDLFKQVMKKYDWTVPGDMYLSSAINDMRRKFLESFSFASFIDESASREENLRMWTFYGGEHKGFKLVFDINVASIYRLVKVTYQDYIPPLDMESFAELLFGPNKWNDRFVREWLSVKSEHWEAEKEWRIWYTKPGGGYYEYKNSSELKEVYFGYKCDEDQKKAIARLIKNDVRYFRLISNEYGTGLVPEELLWFPNQDRFELKD